MSIEENGFVAEEVHALQLRVADPVKTANIKVKLAEGALCPTAASSGSAGYDLYAREDAIIYSNNNASLFELSPTALGLVTIVTFDTGVSLELPNNLIAMVYARSGLGAKGVSLVNGVGVIDSDYRGTIKVVLQNNSVSPYTVRSGDRIAQLVITERFQANFEVVDELDSTERGEGGFGHSGK